MKISRALISVSDKTGVADFARELEKQGVEIVSTGGTATCARRLGKGSPDFPSSPVSRKMLDGRAQDAASESARRTSLRARK